MMEDSSWFDRHPVIGDSFIVIIPAAAVFAMWMIIGVSWSNAAIQAFITSLVFVGGALYIQKQNDKVVFRTMRD